MNGIERTEGTFNGGARAGEVSSILVRPANARLVYVLAHGAGAGMHHHFLEDVSSALAGAGVATFRYQFGYMEKGKRSPDPPAIAQATVRAAVAAAGEATGLPIIAGGKSFGGRMTSSAAAAGGLGAGALAFLGFPLHAPGKPSVARADHLAAVGVPMLFIQGSRDSLATLALIREVIDSLGDRARLHEVIGGDHSFNVRAKDGRRPPEVLEEIVSTFVSWADDVLPPA